MMNTLMPSLIPVNSQVPLPSPALSAFIRGVERRALVVAEFQSGEVVVAERAVAVAMRAFVPVAASLPMSDWPLRFWSLLASTPLLRQQAVGGSWPEDLAHLAVLPEGERLSLLLRIGAGLDEPTAAAVLGVDVPSYQQSLALACPRDPEGCPDALAWRGLAEAVQERVRDLSPLRQEQLNRLRESLVTETVEIDAEGVPAAEPGIVVPEDPRRGRRGRPRAAGGSRRSGLAQWLWLLAGALVLAGAVWAWMARHPGGATAAGEEDSGLLEGNPVETETLQDLPLPPPAEQAPPAPLPEDAQAALARDAGFLAWVAAGSPMPMDESGPAPRPLQAPGQASQARGGL